MHRRARGVLLVALLGIGSYGAGQSVDDPAPPAVNRLEPADAPKAKPWAGLTPGVRPAPLGNARTEDWPDFMGPRRDLQCRETGLAASWPKGGPPLVWSMTRGEGFAAPAIAGGRLVFTHRVDDETCVDCLEAETGKRFWRRSFPCDYRGRYIRDNGARATPVIEGDRVWIHTVDGKLMCLDVATGRTVWQRDTRAEFAVGDDFFGVVSTPILSGDLLIQNVGGTKLGNAGGPTVAAFDKKTGRLRWAQGDEWGPSCASPVLGRVHGRTRLFVLAGGKSRPPTGGLMVLDPATGALDFAHPFRSRTYESVIGSSPVVGEDWVFISSSYGVGSSVLDLARVGTFKVRWKTRRNGLQFSNAVFRDGSLWAVVGRSRRGGRIVEIDPADGKVKSTTELAWDETVTIDGKERTMTMSVGEGSLLATEHGFLCLGDTGHLLALTRGKDGLDVTCRTWLFKARSTWTPLVISRGLLYVCQNENEAFGDGPPRLFCFDLRARARQ